MLPKNEKVDRKNDQKIKIWMYGEPMIGKTIFANQFPNAVFLNTDGNVNYIDSPVLPIRPTKEKDMWELFVDTVQELVTGTHTYETVVVDLVEDIHQACRHHFYKKLKMDHESDAGYGKGWDIVKNSFLIVLTTLLNANLNIVLISHEKEKIVKDRIGRELSVAQPNIQDNVMSKISGIVQITGRVTISTSEKDGQIVDTRVLYLTSTKEQIGGNRIGIDTEMIPLKFKDLKNIYEGELK